MHKWLRINPIFIDNVISNKIDRTFVDQDGTRWIIDYKTSRHEEEDVDAFLDQQHDSMDGGGRNAPGAAFEERYIENSWKNMGLWWNYRTTYMDVLVPREGRSPERPER